MFAYHPNELLIILSKGAGLSDFYLALQKA